MPMNEFAAGAPTGGAKKKSAVAARKAARQKFVSEKVASKGVTKKQANQRFFVQTRMAEMKANGKTVTPEMRKKLQQKFQSGDVARKGFAAPAKKVGVVKPVVTKPVVKPATKSVTQAVRSSDNRSAANISSTRTGLNANHVNRGASQVIRANDMYGQKKSSGSSKKVVIPKK